MKIHPPSVVIGAASKATVDICRFDKVECRDAAAFSQPRYVDAAAAAAASRRPRLKRADISLSAKIDFPVWLYVALPPCGAAWRATATAADGSDERWKKTGDRLPRLARRNEMVKARERKGRERGVTSFPINNKQIGHYPKSMPGEQPGHGNRERGRRALLFPKSVRHAARSRIV
ncbi:hypothetical protein K0M31_017142 [Melipona bicolor]|uniref:Uncharacterized protein n=1 Tax=Melipona bicolor TaxID=60889 RepID=A0AA40FDG2_9HYME|nr:hypothetical protein K0M31_017142 [Melipona bicolor]